MQTLGIDLAAQPERTAAVVVDWEARAVTRVERPADDAALLALAADDAIVRIGIDAPLGLPERYVRAIETWHALGSWPGPPPDVSAEEWKRALRLRRTDRHVHATVGIWPLSVTSDRIAIVAWRAFGLLSTLALRGDAIDRRGFGGRVVEVYPAAANRVWALPAAAGEVAEAAALAGAEHLGDDPHVRDALVCALLARSAHLHPARAVPPEAMREGWIHLPPAPLADALGL